MARISPITNLWGRVRGRRILGERRLVYRGGCGSLYNHQPQITSLYGRLYISWSLGLSDEEEPGQICVFSTSEDLGQTWSDPTAIIDVQPGSISNRVVGSTGIRTYQDNLIAYVYEWEYAAQALDENNRLKVSNHEHHVNTRTVAKISFDAGESWSEAVEIMPKIATYHPPVQTSSGRLILPGHVTYPFTDDLYGLTRWTHSGLSRLCRDFVDDTMGWDHGREGRNDRRIFNEGSFFQTEDGILHMMLRTESDRLWVTESFDDGETWSEPVPTQYTDGICRVHFGQLEDGRFFGLGTPDPTTPWSRTPVVLSLSEDGILFDRQFILGDESEHPPRVAGRGKRGRYGYPYLHVMENWVFVVYSISKEDIEITRFPLSYLD